MEVPHKINIQPRITTWLRGFRYELGCLKYAERAQLSGETVSFTQFVLEKKVRSGFVWVVGGTPIWRYPYGIDIQPRKTTWLRRFGVKLMGSHESWTLSAYFEHPTHI